MSTFLSICKETIGWPLADAILTRSPASAGIANCPLVFFSGHNIEYLCLNLFTLRRFNNNESSGGRQILLPLLGGDAPRLG